MEIAPSIPRQVIGLRRQPIGRLRVVLESAFCLHQRINLRPGGSSSTSAIGLAGTGIVAGLVSTGNVIGRLYYDVIKSDSQLAGMIALGVAGVLLLCLLGCCACYACRERAGRR